MKKVYSTLANDHFFPFYKQYTQHYTGKKDVESGVLIRGGANVVDRLTLRASRYVVTEVTQKQLELLQQDVVFNRMIKRGFLSLNKPDDLQKCKSAQATEKQLRNSVPKKGNDPKKLDCDLDLSIVTNKSV